jgi:hypothetical protein
MQCASGAGGSSSGNNKLREYTLALDKNLDLILAEMDKARGIGASAAASPERPPQPASADESTTADE